MSCERIETGWRFSLIYQASLNYEYVYDRDRKQYYNLIVVSEASTAPMSPNSLPCTTRHKGYFCLSFIETAKRRTA